VGGEKWHRGGEGKTRKGREGEQPTKRVSVFATGEETVGTFVGGSKASV